MQTHYQANKISLKEYAENERFSFSSKPIPSLRNHITWEDQVGSGKNQARDCSAQKGKKRRRKIFQRLSEEPNQPVFGVQQQKQQGYRKEVSRSREVQPESQLRRVRSDQEFMTNTAPRPDITIDSRIESINRKLQSHRSSRNLHNDSSSQISQSNVYQPLEQPQIHQIQQKLSESQMLLSQHEQVLYTKIPKIEQTLNQNKASIHNMQSLLQKQLDLTNKRTNNLNQLNNLHDSKIMIQQQQIQKINSDLIHREIQLVRNKQISKRKQLELIRVKRIEDLQKNNLELYQSIEKNDCFGHFESLEENREELVEGRCWDDDSEGGSKLKFSRNGQQSTIRYENNQMEVSANNTIGEILSPLALSEYQYCI